MEATNPYSKRARYSPTNGDMNIDTNSRTGLHPSQSSTQPSADNEHAASTNDAADVQFTDYSESDDACSFVLDLSTCPEISSMDDKMAQLSLDDPAIGEADEMQKAAIAHATMGGNLFLTGKAGTGKSYTSKQIRARLSDKKMWVVAPTGVAAINVDGMTVHAWGGFGIGSHYSDFDKMMSPENSKKIRQTDVLLFDEISMCSGHFFDVLECMVSIIRCYGDSKDRIEAIRDEAPLISEEMGGSSDPKKSTMSSYMLKMRWEDPSVGGLGDLPPWGGMQLIVVGDFFQLSPVPNRARGLHKGSDRNHLLENDELYEIDYNNMVGTMGVYAFQSRSWPRSNLRTIELTKIHRQSDNDDGLLELLNAMREGEKPLSRLHASAINAIKSPIRPNSDGIIPTELRPKNADVREINKKELDKLEGGPVSFKARDTVEFHEYYKDKLVKKYFLEKLSHLPQIWSSVQEIPHPPRYQVAKEELQKAKTKKEELIEDKNYMALIEMKIDDKIDALEKEVLDIENETKMKNELTLDNVSNWLKDASIEGDPRDFYYDQLSRFDKQLRSDYEKFSIHANERFFSKECRVDDEFILKEKSQVMLLYNLDILNKLANGSRGVVEGFIRTEEYRDLVKAIMEKRDKNNSNHKEGNNQGQDNNSKESVPTKKNEDDRINSCRKEVDDTAETPALEKTQGLAEPADSMDLSNGNSNESAENEVEVLCKMITEWEKEIVMELIQNLNGMQFLNDELTEVERALAANMEKFPVVKFLDGQIRVIIPQAFKKEFKGCGEAQRLQIPLALAWAISIHKRLVDFFILFLRSTVLDVSHCLAVFLLCHSQGMTIDLLRVNLDGCFAPGQAYVACSRGRSADTMCVEGFSEELIITSDLVKQFYSSMKNGYEFSAPTWAMALVTAKNEAEIKKWMIDRYGDNKCRQCKSACKVYKVKKDGKNKGKWILQCEAVYSRHHTWDYLAPPPMT
ncbi:hypothetical protein ACHAXR_009728 [Thalassiosira sp. AJA248-18]